MWAKIKAFLLALLPFKFKSKDDVPPAVQVEIDRLLREAAAKAEALRATNSVEKIMADTDAKLKAAKVAYDDYVNLISQDADRQLKAARAVLPPPPSAMTFD